MAIKLKLEGFDDLLRDIEKAGGTIDKSAAQCMKQSAHIMQNELKTQMQSAEVDSSLINAMPAPQIEAQGNQITASVGYKKGNYDPKNLSDGYKVVFLNYGTPNRTKHGKIKSRGFIQKAKRKASPKIKKQQEQTLNEILAGLKQ